MNTYVPLFDQSQPVKQTNERNKIRKKKYNLEYIQTYLHCHLNKRNTLIRFARLRTLVSKDRGGDRLRGNDCCFTSCRSFRSPNKPFDSATLIINNESNCIISFRLITARKHPESNRRLAFFPKISSMLPTSNRSLSGTFFCFSNKSFFNIEISCASTINILRLTVTFAEIVDTRSSSFEPSIFSNFNDSFASFETFFFVQKRKIEKDYGLLTGVIKKTHRMLTNIFFCG